MTQISLPSTETGRFPFPRDRGELFHTVEGHRSIPFIIPGLDSFEPAYGELAMECVRPLFIIPPGIEQQPVEPDPSLSQELADGSEAEYRFAFAEDSNPPYTILISLAPTYTQFTPTGIQALIDTLTSHGVFQHTVTETPEFPGTGLPYETLAFKIHTRFSTDLLEDLLINTAAVDNWGRYTDPIAGNTFDRYPDELPAVAPHPDAPEVTYDLADGTDIPSIIAETSGDFLETCPTVETSLLQDQPSTVDPLHGELSVTDPEDITPETHPDITHDIAVLHNTVTALNELSRQNAFSTETIQQELPTDEFTASLTDVRDLLDLLAMYDHVEHLGDGMWEPIE